ncbi:MAG: NUDIX domain-containing protein, partial [Planctomycetota bacterium]
MRRSAGGIAVIRREENGSPRWLAQWNHHWQAFHLVGGHKLPGESFHQCVVREVAEELGLTLGDDFHVAESALSQVSYIATSRSAQEDTLYSMELFEVEIRPAAGPKIDSNPLNRWLTESEIRQQRCGDGGAVSPTMQVLLN